jgi:hypothetical protein
MADQPKPPAHSILSHALSQYLPPDFGRAPKDKVEAWLKPRCKDWPPVCTICGLQNWNVNPDIVTIPIWSPPADFEENP